MDPLQPRLVHVRKGRIEPVGSWLYVWVDADDGSVAHIGATGFDPELRAFLHVTSDDPDLGRVRAHVPRWDSRDFDVLAFPLPVDVPRPEVKRILTARLEASEYPHPMPAEALLNARVATVIDAIVDAIEARTAAPRD
ncbi:hypothetical protein ACI7YT_09635 [Microbacterium sp. M]|uniref:hypothetical protein n=1 Tax=Microbacterium sp. M TaxID=3377125 RepID=UPI0038678E73